MKVLHIHGRRWFGRTNGNTYHSVSIWIDGKFKVKISGVYGYGEQYLQTAIAWLEKNELLPDLEHYDNGANEAIWQYCERKNIDLVYYADDVTRKKDL